MNEQACVESCINICGLVMICWMCLLMGYRALWSNALYAWFFRFFKMVDVPCSDLSVAEELRKWAFDSMHFLPRGRHRSDRPLTVEDFRLWVTFVANLVLSSNQEARIHYENIAQQTDIILKYNTAKKHSIKNLIFVHMADGSSMKVITMALTVLVMRILPHFMEQLHTYWCFVRLMYSLPSFSPSCSPLAHSSSNT
jgi:hypothetical protein